MQEKKKSRMRVLQTVIAIILLVGIFIPVGYAIAEEFGTTSTVLTDAGYVIGDTYQRHSWYSDGRHWAFYSNDSAIVYTSSEDNVTWESPTLFSNYSCTLGEGCCNGTVFALWYDNGNDRVDVAYLNVAASNKAIYYKRGRPETNGSIAWGNVHTAVNATVNETYSHPSICTNTLDYPFVTYMVYNSSSNTSYSAGLSTSTTNNSIWTFATNSTINSATTFNITSNVFYPSVIPVSAGNVSLMVVFESEALYLLAQNYADYDVATDTWDYPATAQLPLPATSSILEASLWYHSEVGSVLNLSTPDDVFAVCAANDSVLGQYLWFDRYGDPESPWTSDTNVASGYYAPALGKRNALDYLTLTAIELASKASLYGDDYDMTSYTWDGLVAIAGVDATSGDSVESDYDNAGSDYLGALYYDNVVAFVPDLEFGCYGCTATVTPATIPASVTTMAWVVILVFGALICLMLLGYGAFEVSRGRGNIDLVKIGAIGFITFVIAAIIVENLL